MLRVLVCKAYFYIESCNAFTGRFSISFSLRDNGKARYNTSQGVCRTWLSDAACRTPNVLNVGVELARVMSL